MDPDFWWFFFVIIMLMFYRIMMLYTILPCTHNISISESVSLCNDSVCWTSMYFHYPFLLFPNQPAIVCELMRI